MKRSLILVATTISVLVLAIGNTSATAATAKAGAKCPKVGKVSTVSGVKFTCVKSGKKIIWNKGVKVPAATTSMAPTPAQSTSAPAVPAPTPTKAAEVIPAGYTMKMVAENNKAASCWSAIDGNVYDLTKWINSHPGGSGAIIALCGTDGTAKFKGMHGNQPQQASRLNAYKLGPLSK